MEELGHQRTREEPSFFVFCPLQYKFSAWKT